jgi:hypothetical protein
MSEETRQGLSVEDGKAVLPWAHMTGLNIQQRMLCCMAEIESVEKSGTARIETRSGGSYTYKFAGHDVVAAAVHPVYTKCGVYPQPVLDSWEQKGDTTIFEGRVRFINVDKPEDFLEVQGIGFGQDAGDKGPGKAYSYFIKIVHLKALLLESGEPDNEDAHNSRGSERNQASGAASGTASEKSGRFMRVLMREKDNKAILAEMAKKGTAGDHLRVAVAYMKQYEPAKAAGDNLPKRPSQAVVSGAIDTLKDLPDAPPPPTSEPDPPSQGEPGQGAEGAQAEAPGDGPEPNPGEWPCENCGTFNPISANLCGECGMPAQPPEEPAEAPEPEGGAGGQGPEPGASQEQEEKPGGAPMQACGSCGTQVLKTDTACWNCKEKL